MFGGGGGDAGGGGARGGEGEWKGLDCKRKYVITGKALLCDRGCSC